MGQKEKKELVILAVAIMVLIFLGVRMNRAPKNVTTTPGIPERNIIMPLSVDKLNFEEKGAEPEETREQKYTGRETKDPLDNSAVLKEISGMAGQIGDGGAFGKEGLLVSAVIWGSEKPQAIINNKIVNIGEMFNGGKIVGIDKQGVHVSYEGKEVLLPIK